jgi:hypothetical protein
LVSSTFFRNFAAEILKIKSMSATLITLVIVLVIATFVGITRAMISEEELIEKAETNWFYHTLAKMTSAKYNGYVMSEAEKKAMEESLAEPSEYDRHPIGSYFKLCDSLKSTLKTRGNFHNYSLNFNMGEVGTGFAVLAVFAIVVTLGVIYG